MIYPCVASKVVFSTCGLFISWQTWLYGTSIPIKAVMDGLNDGTQVRDVTVIYHILYNQQVIIQSQQVITTQLTINDVSTDVLCHATGDPHYITFDVGP